MLWHNWNCVNRLVSNKPRELCIEYIFLAVLSPSIVVFYSGSNFCPCLRSLSASINPSTIIFPSENNISRRGLSVNIVSVRSLPSLVATSPILRAQFGSLLAGTRVLGPSIIGDLACLDPAQRVNALGEGSQDLFDTVLSQGSGHMIPGLAPEEGLDLYCHVSSIEKLIDHASVAVKINSGLWQFLLPNQRFHVGFPVWRLVLWLLGFSCLNGSVLRGLSWRRRGKGEAEEWKVEGRGWGVPWNLCRKNPRRCPLLMRVSWR